MPVREIVDQDQRQWTVWDTYPQSARLVSVMKGFEAGWLTFECEQEKRRLHPVPADWETVPDAGLREYLASAAVVEPRKRMW